VKPKLAARQESVKNIMNVVCKHKNCPFVFPDRIRSIQSAGRNDMAAFYFAANKASLDGHLAMQSVLFSLLREAKFEQGQRQRPFPG